MLLTMPQATKVEMEVARDLGKKVQRVMDSNHNKKTIHFLSQLRCFVGSVACWPMVAICCRVVPVHMDMHSFLQSQYLVCTL